MDAGARACRVLVRMTTSTQSLAGWLLERIAEDEAVAELASDRAVGGPYRRSWELPFSAEVDPGAGASFNTNDRDIANHIARWDPARVLAECESKRRIVELHRPSAEGYEDDGPQEACLLCQWDVDCDMVRYDHQYPDHARNHARWWPCDTLRLLAVPYADRPGYREEWRPQ